jgi:feruloyl-CoA synthase
MLSFDALCASGHSAEMEAAHMAVTGDSVAKFLFTSGTTGTPKAVIQPHGMLCANQQMVLQCYAFLADTPPVVVDWAPWNHTASGNKVFNLVIYNGGTFYIDDGRPTPALIEKTIRNLREISPTWYFNVPLGYQMLLDAMETDAALRETFFSRVQMLMYAGAGMSQPIWDRITHVADEMVPGGVLLCTGFGSTETGPFALMCTERQDRAGNLGIPAHGVILKLAPQGDKLEGRVKGPAVTPGYWRNPEMSAEAFDEEGFYRFGDAFRFVENGNPAAGFRFDGRLAENFKLASGTWVAVGALRARLTDDLKGLASDVVIAGEDRMELGALVLPDWSALRTIAGDASLEGEALLNHPKVREAAAEMLEAHAARASGSASRVVRMMFLDVPLSFDKGEVTDKGSINQRAVLQHRADMAASLWSDDPRVIALSTVRAG